MHRPSSAGQCSKAVVGEVLPARSGRPAFDRMRHSAQNYNNVNGIYDRDGNRIGYAVPRADGSGINYFDNSGRRTGYLNYENR